RQRQAAAVSGRPKRRRDRLRHRVAVADGAGCRPQRHRGRGRRAARACSAGDVGAAAKDGVMAQLSDDCFAFSGPLLKLDDMERLISERVAPVTETERVPLSAARLRVVARDVIAPVDLPPFDNSAVDGYAVRHADLKPDGKTMLTIAGRLTAGANVNLALKPGEAVRIFTGA